MKQGRKSWLRHGAAGMVIGASMLVPGVSGGTMAIILGIYDRLVAAVSVLPRKWRGSLPLLAAVGVGGIVGAVCFSGILLRLMAGFEKPMRFLFLGAVAGSLPALWKKAKGARKLDSMLYIAVGLLLALLLGTAPPGLLQADYTSFGGRVLLIGAGIALSVALVLPGISMSYMLLVLGLYETALQAMGGMDLPFLLFLGTGLVLGVLGTTRVLEKAMTRYTKETYLLILGFVAAAMGEVFPGLPTGEGVVGAGACCVLLLAGGAVTFLLSRRFGE